MEALKKIWHKLKGTIAMAALTLLVGLGVLASAGLQVVEGGPEGSVCIAAMEAPVEAVTNETDAE